MGQGHLYQGRYKSFLCQEDGHFLTVARYIERNAKKANFVRTAESWRWSSVWRREYGTEEQKQILSQWSTPQPKNYLVWLNQPQTEEEEDAIQRSLEKNIPFGDEGWIERMVTTFGLAQVLRGVGRPKKNGD